VSSAVEPSEANSRRLHPVLAFFAGVLGFGYVYAGKIKLAFAYIATLAFVLLVAAWTRWIVDPLAWYPIMLVVVAIVLVPIVHPVVIAWGRPTVVRNRYNRWWFYLLWVVGFAAVSETVSVTNRATTLGYDIFRLPSGSMEPTLVPGDWIVVDSWRYFSVPPAFADVVVYRSDDEITYLKRIVGLPGDTLEMSGRVLVRNGSPVDEPYIHEPLPGLPGRGIAPVTLGPDEYFVLGDNRDNSQDSRYTGPIRGAEIVGRGEFIALSFSGGVQWGRFRTRLAAD